MNYLLRNKEISKNRELFIRTGSVKGDSIRTEILESWKRCKMANLDASESKLQLMTSIKERECLVTDYSRFLKQSSLEFYESKHAAVGALGAAMYYINSDGVIFIRAGDPELIRKLKSINLAFGTDLSELEIGTTAYSLAFLKKGERWVFGAEHYIEALQDYVTAAIPMVGDYNRQVYIMIVLPLENYNEQAYAFIHFLLIMEKTYYGVSNMYDKSLKDYLFQKGMDDENAMYLMVNGQYLIISANQRFFDLFGMEYTEVVGKNLCDVIPSMDFTIESMALGKSVSNREVRFPELKSGDNRVYLSLQPVREIGKDVGMVIKMVPRSAMRKIVQRMVNYTARYTFDDLLGVDPQFLNAVEQSKKASLSNSTILILGESGTGKELFAHAIHYYKDGPKKPFVSINCGALPRELIGSELFGYVEGAFTGARKGGAQGKFELAHGGTLFLDEISELPLDMQSVLLRVLEDKMVTRLGDNHPQQVDVRLIAATNENLYEMVRMKKFREDLYYRLNVIKIEMIPLRERTVDISILAEHFLRSFTVSQNKEVVGFTDEAMNVLESFAWPGNIRELRNCIERSIGLCNGKLVTINDIPEEIQNHIGYGLLKDDWSETKIPHLKDRFDKEEEKMIKNLMDQHNGNKSLVAKELGIARTTLYRKLSEMKWNC